jgi:hypothetical protein
MDLGGTWMICKRERCLTARSQNPESPLTDGLIKCEKRCGTVGMLLGFGYYKSNDVLEMGRGAGFPLFSAN